MAPLVFRETFIKQWSFGTLGTTEIRSGSIHLSMLQRLKDMNFSIISCLEIYRRLTKHVPVFDKWRATSLASETIV